MSFNSEAAPRQTRHAPLVPFFSWGVLRFLCWDYYLQGNRPTHLFRLPLEHKEVVRTLKFSGQALALSACTLICIYLWLRDILSNPTTAIVILFQFLLFSLITVQIKKNSGKSNYFALSSLKKVKDDWRISFQVISFIIIIIKKIKMVVGGKKGHCWDKWMCALARITGVDKSQAKMRVSASLPTANAIMEMRSMNQHT